MMISFQMAKHKLQDIMIKTLNYPKIKTFTISYQNAEVNRK